MRDGPAFKFTASTLFWMTLLGAFCLVVGKAVFKGSALGQNFVAMGNDDIMRLVVVRDLIAGQSWFDTTQYRLMPPEGVLMHWSRYVDAGIAAIILPLSWVFPMPLAEQIAAAVWPTLIMLTTLVIFGFGTRKIFGAPAACFAMLCLVLWPLTADVHMAPGNLDHHNMQFLLMAVVIFGVIWPARDQAAGVVAGIAAGFSLAVGLENLVFLVVAGLILVTQAAFDVRRPRLFAFCVALIGSSVLFWLGQAAPASRFVPICDQLGTPILGLVAVGALAATLPLLVLRGIAQPWVLLGAISVLALIGLALIWPLFGPCFDGPYANLSQDLQDYIGNRIIEALPAIGFIRYDPLPAFVFLLPVVAALLLGSIYWWRQRDDLPEGQSRAIAALLVFCVCGTAVVFYQMRTVIMVAAVVPIIGGAVMAHLLARYLSRRDGLSGALMLVVTTLFVAPTPIAVSLQSLVPEVEKSDASTPANCRSVASLQSLDAVPRAQILSDGNMGSLILWGTHHDALSAPYHRSAAALSNGIFPFGMPEEEFAAHLRGSGASHLLLCRDQRYDGAFATDLAAGGAADWLVPVPLDDDAQLLFTIVQQ